MTPWQEWVKHPQDLWIRRAFFQVHLWVGLGIGLYVLVISISGSAIIYRRELMSNSSLKRVVVAESRRRMSAEELTQQAQRAYPTFEVDNIREAQTPDEPDDVVLERDHKRIERLFDPYTGADLGDPHSMIQRVVEWLVDLHDNLLAGQTGRLVNGVGSCLITLLSVTGAVLWWPGIKNWRRSTHDQLEHELAAGELGLAQCHRLLVLVLCDGLGNFGYLLLLSRGLHSTYPPVWRIISFLDRTASYGQVRLGHRGALDRPGTRPRRLGGHGCSDVVEPGSGQKISRFANGVAATNFNGRWQSSRRRRLLLRRNSSQGAIERHCPVDRGRLISREQAVGGLCCAHHAVVAPDVIRFAIQKVDRLYLARVQDRYQQVAHRRDVLNVENQPVGRSLGNVHSVDSSAGDVIDLFEVEYLAFLQLIEREVFAGLRMLQVGQSVSFQNECLPLLVCSGPVAHARKLRN